MSSFKWELSLEWYLRAVDDNVLWHDSLLNLPLLRVLASTTK